jgi:hypothetical protein
MSDDDTSPAQPAPSPPPDSPPGGALPEPAATASPFSRPRMDYELREESPFGWAEMEPLEKAFDPQPKSSEPPDES